MAWINNGDSGLSVRTKLNTIPNDGTDCTAITSAGPFPATNVTGVVNPINGGTGITNNVASTWEISGNFSTIVTITANTAITLPTSGLLLADGGPLGTPSSAVLTNATGLPPAGVVGTAAVLGSNTFIGNQTLSSAAEIFSGNISGAGIWGTVGNRFKMSAAAITDTTASGTIALVYANVAGAPTFVASGAAVITNGFNWYFNDPVAGSGPVTLTNKWALGADSARFGTTNPVTIATNGVVNISNGVILNPAGSGIFGTSSVGITSNIIEIANAGSLAWISGATVFGTVDLAIYRLGAANMRQGLIPSATPIAQTFTLGEASRPGTDSNVGGANGTLQSGLGTGTGTPSNIIIQTPSATASGTGVQTQTTRLTINSTGITFAVSAIAGVSFREKGYTVGTLPAGTQGDIVFVTDALTVTPKGTIVAAGGTAIAPLFYDGTNYVGI